MMYTAFSSRRVPHGCAHELFLKVIQSVIGLPTVVSDIKNQCTAKYIIRIVAQLRRVCAELQVFFESVFCLPIKYYVALASWHM